MRHWPISVPRMGSKEASSSWGGMANCRARQLAAISDLTAQRRRFTWRSSLGSDNRPCYVCGKRRKRDESSWRATFPGGGQTVTICPRCGGRV